MREKWGYLQKREFFETEKVVCEGASQNLLKSCLSFRESLQGSNEEKIGRQQNRKKRFCSEMWGNTI